MVSNNQPHGDFESVAFEYVEQMYRVAYARVGNKQDAEDIVQETYLNAFKSFSSFRRGANFKNWLTQILINNVRDHFRKTGRTVTTVEMDDDLDDQAMDSMQIGPEEELCNSEIDPQLVAALKMLPDGMLTPLILREIDDASYDDIASILDIPKGTVMSRLFRARSLLRKKLTGANGLHYIQNDMQNTSRGSSYEMQ